jgi:hypothetical protein
MNFLIRAADIYTPTPLKRKKLLELFSCTAAAFGGEMPPVRGLAYGELLRSYARFTAVHADQVLRQDNAVIACTEPSAPGGSTLPDIRRRLYDGAYRMGRDLRRAFRVTSTADALAAARVLYRALGIELTATAAGEIMIRRCFFSEFYSSPVCGLIASLDQGLFAGLSDGGRLAFTQRITEGNPCCSAALEFDPGDHTHP